MKKVFLSMMALAFLAACGDAKKGNQTTQEQETVQTITETKDYSGVYKGVLPAASSPGIETTLTLKKDYSYSLHAVFLEEKEGVVDEKGTYTVEDNVLVLKSDANVISYYKPEENQVRMLNSDKQEVSGELAEHYVLRKE